MRTTIKQVLEGMLKGLDKSVLEQEVGPCPNVVFEAYNVDEANKDQIGKFTIELVQMADGTYAVEDIIGF